MVRTPCLCGYRPVSSVTQDGNVRGSETYARSNRVPVPANLVVAGIVRGTSRSARSESAARMSTFILALALVLVLVLVLVLALGLALGLGLGLGPMAKTLRHAPRPGNRFASNPRSS